MFEFFNISKYNQFHTLTLIFGSNYNIDDSVKFYIKFMILPINKMKLPSTIPNEQKAKVNCERSNKW